MFVLDTDGREADMRFNCGVDKEGFDNGAEGLVKKLDAVSKFTDDDGDDVEVSMDAEGDNKP